MDQSSTTIQNSNILVNFIIGFIIIGIILIVLIIFFCCRAKGWFIKDRRSSSSNSIESFQQLYFTKTSYDQIINHNQRIIERWSSIEQPSLTFYRVYIQDDPDELFYKPVTQERACSSIEQSKAMEYTGHEIIFF